MSLEKQSPGRTSVADIAGQVKGIRWSHAAIAFCLAVALWYTVTVRDKVESWVDVQVVFRNAPDNLVISDGLINRLAVRVRAARGLSRALSSRDATAVVDLSGITKGSNAIAIKRDMLSLGSAFEVVEVSPSRIVIEADTRASKSLPLEISFAGKLPADYYVKDIRLDPDAVTVRGAESVVSGMTQVTIPVPLAQDTPLGRSTLTVAVPAPFSVTVAPPQVSVDLDVALRTRSVTITRTVTYPELPDGLKPLLKPARVAITAEIPESVVKDEKKMAAITASVVAPQEPGEYPAHVPVTVSLPEGAVLTSITPAEVILSLPLKK